MKKGLLLNNSPWNFTVDDLPCLVHGKDKVGSSLFTVSLVADLYSQGSKFLFLSGYHMARDEFISQTREPENTILIEDQSSIQSAESKRTIFIPRERMELFIKAIERLTDIQDRIVLIKNFDLFDESIFKAVEKNNKLILSGDLDKCLYKEKVISKEVLLPFL